MRRKLRAYIQNFHTKTHGKRLRDLGAVILDLYNNAFNSSDYTASNDRIISEQRIGQDMKVVACSEVLS
jgi:hypothetical protein